MGAMLHTGAYVFTMGCSIVESRHRWRRSWQLWLKLHKQSGCACVSAGSAGGSCGRTRDEIRQAAMGIQIRDAIRAYRGKVGLPMEFSYSLETEEPYDAGSAEDRAALLEGYGDGYLPVYMIAVTDTIGTFLMRLPCWPHWIVRIMGWSRFLEGGFLMMLFMRMFP